MKHKTSNIFSTSCIRNIYFLWFILFQILVYHLGHCSFQVNKPLIKRSCSPWQARSCSFSFIVFRKAWSFESKQVGVKSRIRRMYQILHSMKFLKFHCSSYLFFIIVKMKCEAIRWMVESCIHLLKNEQWMTLRSLGEWRNVNYHSI